MVLCLYTNILELKYSLYYLKMKSYRIFWKQILVLIFCLDSVSETFECLTKNMIEKVLLMGLRIKLFLLVVDTTHFFEMAAMPFPCKRKSKSNQKCFISKFLSQK